MRRDRWHRRRVIAGMLLPERRARRRVALPRSPCGLHAIHQQLERHEHRVGGIQEVQVIVQRHRARGRVETGHAHRPIHVLELQQPGMRRAVRVHQAVHAEIAEMRVLARIAAVRVLALAGRVRATVDRMVAPLPDEAADQAVITLDAREIILQIARAVAHRMAEFAQHVRLDAVVAVIAVAAVAQPVRRARPLLGEVLVDLLDGRVHAAVYVKIAVIALLSLIHIPGALIVRQAARVEGLRPQQRRLERTAVRTLVAHRPEDDARMVLVALHAALRAVNGRRDPRGVVGDRPVPALVDGRVALVRMHAAHRAVALVVSLGHHVEAETVVQVVEVRRVRVMAGADRVDVVLLHQREVAHELLLADDRAGHRVAVVPVDAVELDRLAVDLDHIAIHADLADADERGDDLVRGGVHDGVQVRRLGGPQMRVVDRQGCVRGRGERAVSGESGAVRAAGERAGHRRDAQCGLCVRGVIVDGGHVVDRLDDAFFFVVRGGVVAASAGRVVGFARVGLCPNRHVVLVPGRRIIDRLRGRLCHQLAILIEQLHLDRHIRIVEEREIHVDRRVIDRRRIIFVIADAGLNQRGIDIAPNRRMHEHVTNRMLGTVQQIHVTEDAAHAELVLILLIAAVAPLQHQHGQRVHAVLQHVGHIELAGRMRHLRIPDELAVHPHIERRIHALEIQVRAGRVRIGRMHEIAQVHAARVVLRHERRVERERIVEIRVLVAVETMVLPHARHRRRRKAVRRQRTRGGSARIGVLRCVIPAEIHVIEHRAAGGAQSGDLGVQVVDARIILEIPVAVQQHETIGIHAILADRVHRRGRGHVIRAVRLRADM